jgi:hypothetical protein
VEGMAIATNTITGCEENVYKTSKPSGGAQAHNLRTDSTPPLTLSNTITNEHTTILLLIPIIL